MSEGVDKDAVRAWAGALRSGLGLVRFSDLPKPVFEQLLSSAAYQSCDLHVVIAENATLEGLEELTAEFFEDTVVMEAVAKRRVELMGRGNVVAFPSLCEDAHQNPSIQPTAVKGKWSIPGGLRRLGLRMLAAFEEEPSAFDQPEGIRHPVETPLLRGALPTHAPQKPNRK